MESCHVEVVTELGYHGRGGDDMEKVIKYLTAFAALFLVILLAGLVLNLVLLIVRIVLGLLFVIVVVGGVLLLLRRLRL